MGQELFKSLGRRPVMMAAPLQHTMANVQLPQQQEQKPLPTWEEIKKGWGIGDKKDKPHKDLTLGMTGRPQVPASQQQGLGTVAPPVMEYVPPPPPATLGAAASGANGLAAAGGAEGAAAAGNGLGAMLGA